MRRNLFWLSDDQWGRIALSFPRTCAARIAQTIDE